MPSVAHTKGKLFLGPANTFRKKEPPTLALSSNRSPKSHITKRLCNAAQFNDPILKQEAQRKEYFEILNKIKAQEIRADLSDEEVYHFREKNKACTR